MLRILCFGRIGRKRDDLIEIGLRFLVLLQLNLGEAAIVVALGALRIHVHRLGKVHLGITRIVLVEKEDADVGIDRWVGHRAGGKLFEKRSALGQVAVLEIEIDQKKVALGDSRIRRGPGIRRVELFQHADRLRHVTGAVVRLSHHLHELRANLFDLRLVVGDQRKRCLEIDNRFFRVLFCFLGRDSVRYRCRCAAGGCLTGGDDVTRFDLEEILSLSDRIDGFLRNQRRRRGGHWRRLLPRSRR